MTISWSDHGRIILESSFLLAEAIQGFSADILNSEFRGKRNIWWCWMETSVAPRIVNDVSYVRNYYHKNDFAWQAQYLLQLEGDSCCSAHCKWRFISDVDQSWDSFCVAGAVFGEVGVSLFVAGAAFREILIDSWSAKCSIFPYKMRLQDAKSKVSEAAGARWRFHGRIMVGLSSNRLSIGGSNSGIFRWHLELRILWQAQYLVMLDGNQCCSAHCKWRFICEELLSWEWVCVASAVFAAVRGWLWLLRAL